MCRWNYHYVTLSRLAIVLLLLFFILGMRFSVSLSTCFIKGLVLFGTERRFRIKIYYRRCDEDMKYLISSCVNRNSCKICIYIWKWYVLYRHRLCRFPLLMFKVNNKMRASNIRGIYMNVQSPLTETPRYSGAFQWTGRERGVPKPWK